MPSKEQMTFQFPTQQATVYDQAVLTTPPTQEEYLRQAEE
jgi:hypothetical protein